MAEENLSLKQSVEKAATEIQETKETKTEGAPEQQKTESEQKPQQQEETHSDSELEEAIAFYRALKDPKQQNEIIYELAQRAGLLTQKQENKGELTKAETKGFADVLSEILSEEYPDLQDKLGKVFDAYDKQQEAKFNSLMQTMSAEKTERMVSEFESEFSTFLKANNVTEEIAAKMNREIAELPPPTGQNGKKISLTQYLTKIHRLVAGEQKQIQQDVKRNEKIHNNLKERSTNLSSDVDENRLRKGSALPSLKESIAAASRGETLD